MNRYSRLLVIGAGALVVSGCFDKTPDRNYFPLIKRQIVELQTAVKNRDRVPLEKLLVSDYASRGGADSVVQFAFGTDPSFQFAAFSKAEILYTNDRARVDCVIVDSTGRELRPATLTFEHVNNAWLLKRIEPRLPATDSTQS
jgi:hypothetical protein